jgi:DNA-binding PadR family transcriptional regulator
MHGYRLMEELEDREFVEKGRFESPSVYNILKRMEKRGLLTSEKVKTESVRIRRVYSITSRGEDTLKEGLTSLIKRRKITDKLIDYYNENFSRE